MSLFKQRGGASEIDLQLKQQIRKLRDEIVDIRRNKQPKSQVWEESRSGKKFLFPSRLGKKKEFIGRQDGNLAAIDLFNTKAMFLTSGAKTDGEIILWDIAEDYEEIMVLPNAWMTCGVFEKQDGDMVACGGLTNNAYVVDVRAGVASNSMDPLDPIATFVGHDAVVYDINFTSDRTILTAAGDQTLRIWDIETQESVAKLRGHTGDVFCCDIHPRNSPNIFISGGADFTARFWDIRDCENKFNAQSTLTFDTKSRDVNGIRFFPDGCAFATALNNSTTHLYDTRASTKILTFRHPETYESAGTQDVEFSVSGRLMFVRHKNQKVLVYDVAGPTKDSPDGEAINESVINDAIYSENAETICMHPQGTIFAVGCQNTNKNEIQGHVYWPNK